MTVENLTVLNAQLNNFNSPIGFRATDVSCVSRDGRRIQFVNHSEVPGLTEKCLTMFEENMARAIQIDDISFSCALFWIGFIAIHPFMDANGRTAKAVIAKELNKKRFHMITFDLIDRYLIEGNIDEDLGVLQKLFLASIEPIQ